ncbi:putative mitochondrial protein AtMg00310 [Castanea sativa]|uniref:putative mitochondrial protein AtMg00310 n=1 Tax=Castanea sativa TaxID=21020 RepID=UPI003F651A7A
MSCFKLPIGLCNDIEKLIQKFGGYKEEIDEKFIGKIGRLCKPKAQGGLGFQDLCKFNDAMLAKRFWQLVTNTDSLLYKVFKSKYFPNGNISYAKPNSGSFAWRSVLRARKVISIGARWRIGDGTQIRIFNDNWLPHECDGKIISPPSIIPRNATVFALIDSGSCWWNSQLIDESFLPFETQKIKDIPLCAIA